MTLNRTHTDREYGARLAELRQQLLVMAGRVEAMLDKSVKALVERDTELARATIEADSVVNQDEIDIDQLCLQILARWQPMASDLRFITIALKMVTDLERIGDLAVNICERAVELNNQPPLKPYEDLPKMGQLVTQMVHDAIDAFIEGDEAKARRVHKQDDVVDDLYDHVFGDVLALMIQDPSHIHRGIHIQSVAKWLERVGDHATNLAEVVVYMVRGRDIRHQGRRADAEPSTSDS